MYFLQYWLSLCCPLCTRTKRCKMLVGSATRVVSDRWWISLCVKQTWPALLTPLLYACFWCATVGTLVDDLEEFCDVDVIYDLACDNCEVLDESGIFCRSCETCQSNANCDVDELVERVCQLCDFFDDGDEDDGDEDDGDGGGGIACFSKVATLQTPEGPVTMQDLQIGDRVLTATGTYETVYAFGHYHPSQPADFFQLHHSLGNKNQALEVTADHLVFLQGKAAPVPAQNIQVGDNLMTSNSEDAASVTEITKIRREGIYAPLTMHSGTVVVDGVVASSYVTLDASNPNKQQLLNDHQLVHMALSPYRLLCNGVSHTFCETRIYMDNGMPHYAHYGMQLLNWLLSSHWIITQWIGLSMIVLVTGTFQLLEMVFGASLTPLFVLLVATMYHRNKTSKSTVI
jgi:Hint module